MAETKRKVGKPNIDLREKLDLLSMTRGWTHKDVRRYFGIGQTKALDLVKNAEEVKYFKGYYTIESVLKLFGLNRITEMQTTLMQLGYFDKVDTYNIDNIED